MKIVNKNLPIDEEIEINKIVIKDSFYKKGGKVFIVNKDGVESEVLDEKLRKIGHWIFNPKDAIEMMFSLPKCSVCGYESSDGGNYCSNCGSRMIEKELKESILNIDEHTIVIDN